MQNSSFYQSVLPKVLVVAYSIIHNTCEACINAHVMLLTQLLNKVRVIEGKTSKKMA